MNEPIAVNGSTGYKLPKFERAVISHYQIYEVKDWELEMLKDNNGGICFNVAISAFFCALGMLASLLASPPQDPVIGAYLKSVVIFAFVAAVVAFGLSRREKRKANTVYRNILQRAEDQIQPICTPKTGTIGEEQ